MGRISGMPEGDATSRTENGLTNLSTPFFRFPSWVVLKSKLVLVDEVGAVEGGACCKLGTSLWEVSHDEAGLFGAGGSDDDALWSMVRMLASSTPYFLHSRSISNIWS